MATNKTLIVYNYYSKNDNTDYFLEHGLTEDDSSLLCVDYMFVINRPDLSLPNEILEKHQNVSYYNRENSGRDFAAYGYAIDLKKKEGTLSDYDYFIFLNQTVIGPFFPVWYKPPTDHVLKEYHWSKIFTDMINEECKLSGISINCHFLTNNTYMPHVQGMFLVTDRVGLDLGIEEGIFDHKGGEVENKHYLGVIESYKEKWDTIYEKEMGFSRVILSNDYNISCLMSCYKGVDFRERPEITGNDPWGDKAYFSCNLHPYELIFFKNNRGVEDKLIKNLTTWNKI